MASHIERCKKLAASVELLSQTEIEELFKMIHRCDCRYTKNNNGIFVNLAWITPELLEQLEHYVAFCNRSGCELKKYESLCDVLNNKMQNERTISATAIRNEHVAATAAANSDAANLNSGPGGYGCEDEKMINKVSSSMRFSLLKKKFAKVQLAINLESDLKADLFTL
jgi:hypothetical protein